MPEIHAHDVLDLMSQSGRQFTRASLIALIGERYGPDARFHTCSAAGMTATELVEFLARRGKFAGTEEGFILNPQRVCNH